MGKMRNYGFSKVLTLLLALALTLSFTALSFAFTRGDKVEVSWKGSWYPATVLKTKGDLTYIHYDGYSKSWDEWVGLDRIRSTDGPSSSGPSSGLYSAGDPVDVKWKGSWYPAHVLRASGNQTYIHYDGYDSSWDEWVGPERIRPAGRAAPVVVPPPPTTTTVAPSVNINIPNPFK
ncbi:MAG: hypothetical protein H7844_12800 [Nitrospirae bacterium YQR-1]